MEVPLKCKKCRKFLLDSKCLVDSHGNLVSDFQDLDRGCDENSTNEVWNVNYDLAPDWMKNCFDVGSWLKGKIFCPKCEGRIGSFNFTQPRKCACAGNVAQPVWILKSKVDAAVVPKILQPKRVVIDRTWTIINAPIRDSLDSKHSKLLDGDLEASTLLNESCNLSLGGSKLLKSKPYKNNSESDDSVTTDNVATVLARSKSEQLKLIKKRHISHKPSNQNKDMPKKHPDFLKKLKGKLYEEYKCPICLELCFIPSQCLPCKHVFCHSCLQKNSSYAAVLRCPMCRKKIYTYSVNEDLNKFLQDAFSVEIAEKKKRLKEMRNEGIGQKLEKEEAPYLSMLLLNSSLLYIMFLIIAIALSCSIVACLVFYFSNTYTINN